MKKFLVIGGLAAFALLSLGCNNDTGTELNGLVDIGDLGKGYDLVRDTNTGCVYIYERRAKDARPLTPYFDENGEVVGCGDEDLDKAIYN